MEILRRLFRRKPRDMPRRVGDDSLRLLVLESCSPIDEPLGVCKVVDASITDDRVTVTLLCAAVSQTVSAVGEQPWTERCGSGSAKAAKHLRSLYRASGLSTDSCDVSGKPDTSDTQAALEVFSREGQQQGYLKVNMLHSGFTGPDSRALRDLIRGMLDLVEPNIYSITLGR